MNLYTQMKEAFESQPDLPKDKNWGGKIREGTRKWDNEFRKWLLKLIDDKSNPLRDGAVKMLALDDLPSRRLKIPSKSGDPYRHEFDMKFRFMTRYQGNVLGLRVFVSFNQIHASWIETIDKFMMDQIAAFLEMAKSYGIEPAKNESQDKMDFSICNAGYYILAERNVYLQLACKTPNLSFNDDYTLLEKLGVEHDKR